MKKLILPLFILINITVFSQVSPAATFHQLFSDSVSPRLDYVNDFENIFTPPQIQHLDSLLADFKRVDSFDISVVTIDTSFVKASEFDSLVHQLAARWGIGQVKRSKGVVIGISRGYGRIRIYNGYEVSDIMSYKDTKLLIDLDFVPFYKKKNYYEGTVNGLTELMKVLTRKK